MPHQTLKLSYGPGAKNTKNTLTHHSQTYFFSLEKLSLNFVYDYSTVTIIKYISYITGSSNLCIITIKIFNHLFVSLF